MDDMPLSPDAVSIPPSSKSAQFYVEFADSTFSTMIENLMSRLLQLGYRVSAVAVSGLARPRMVIGEAIYAGIEAIESFVRALEDTLKALLGSATPP
jgi:hypothetical protein